MIEFEVGSQRHFSSTSARAVGALLVAINFNSVQLHAQSRVPLFDLPAASGVSSTTFASILNVVELANGQIAVNDVAARQIVLMERTLTKARVLLDSGSSVGTGALPTYGRSAITLTNCNCPEVWFPDQQARAIVVFSSSNFEGKTIAPPKPVDFGYLLLGRSTADTVGNLIYTLSQLGTGGILAAALQVHRDSTILVRANFESRKVDTVAHLRTKRRPGYSTEKIVRGAPIIMHISLDILPPLDEWAVTPDGTIAVVRGHDYHVDWYAPNGRMTASPKMPYPFKRLSDADKIVLRDSATASEVASEKAAAEALRARGGIQVRRPNSEGGGLLPNFNPPYVPPVVDSTPLEKIPDYYPPIRSGAVTADLQGNVWILPTVSTFSQSGELIYDVVRHDRGLIARIRVPTGRSIVGFGTAGTVYMASRTSDRRWVLERSSMLNGPL